MAMASAAHAEPVVLSPTFGTGIAGGAAGQVSFPADVDVDAQGSVWIADVNNARINVFAADGSFLRAFGHDVIPGAPPGFEVCTAATTCGPGTPGGGAGQMAAPTGIAFDKPRNLLYVQDQAARRVAVFNIANPAAPEFVRAFGKNVDSVAAGTDFEICTANCQTGVMGTGPGEFSNAPLGIATDAAGNVYVSDQSADRVMVYAPDGSFAHAFGHDVDPGGGTGFEVCSTATGCKAGLQNGGAAGSIGSPHGLAFDGAGRLFIASAGNRLDVFDAVATNPHHVRSIGANVIPGGPIGLEACTAVTGCQFGAATGDAGALSNPLGIAFDNSGNAVVGELGSGRVSILNTAPTFVLAFGHDVIPGGPTGFEVCTTTTTCKVGTIGSAPGQFQSAWGTAVDCRGGIYAVEPNNNRVEKFGEPGTANPPCPTAGGTTPKPSNDFSLGKPKRNTKKGTATLTATVPGAGALALAGSGVKAASATAAKLGDVTLKVKATGRKKEKLADKGKVKVEAKVTYTPTGGDPKALSAKVKLVRKPKR